MTPSKAAGLGKGTAEKAAVQEPATAYGNGATDAIPQDGSEAKSSATSATSATHGLKSAGESTLAAGQNVASKAKAGGRRVAEAPAKATAAATATWTVLKARKLIVGGVGVSLAALVGASYAAGNRASKRSTGPLTRLTHGRL